MRKPVITNCVGSFRAAAIALLLSSCVAAADDSLARLVPADVGLFIELRQADDLLVPLAAPQLWLTIAELAGQPASHEDTALWERRIERTINMTPTAAIETLFSRRVAFVAHGPRSTQDGVVLCRPAGNLDELIRGWRTSPLPSAHRASVYSLPHHVGLARIGDVLIFGDDVSTGLFDTVLDHGENARSTALADSAAYKGLLARVPANPDGIFFARLATPTTSRPTTSGPAAAPSPLAHLPRLFRDSENVLLALHRSDQLLRISEVGDGRGAAQKRGVLLRDLADGLPGDTLLTWAGYVDYAALRRSTAAMAKRSLFRIAHQLQESAGNIQRLSAALDGATCVAVGALNPAQRLVPAPPIPAVALLLGTRQPQLVEREWSNLLHSSLAIYNLLVLRLPDARRLPEIERLDLDGIAGEQLDLSNLFGGAIEQTPLGELHLSWALDGDTLIIASHTQWLRQVLAARHGKSARMGAVLGLAGSGAGEPRETIFVAQTGPIADLGQFWLAYFKQTVPHVLDESWWRDYQPGGGAVQLGVQATEDGENRRLRIQSVTAGMPAAGLLQPGDMIVGCNRRRFATSQPVREIRAGLAQRPNARWIDLFIQRDRVVRARRVPLPFVDPIEVLRRLVAVGQVVQRVVYLDDAPDATGSRGYLTLQLRSGTERLFEFPPFLPATDSATKSPGRK